MLTKTHSDFTKYPKIFGRAYWGAFEGEAKQHINDNRNDFVTEFGVKGHYKMPQYMHERVGGHLFYCGRPDWFDHIETYKTKDNRCIIVNSPYSVSEDSEKKLIGMGYIKYKPLYNDMATTYIYTTPIGRY
jgi:hypothetical protein